MGDSVSEDDNKHNGFFVWRDEAYKMGVEEAFPDHPVIYIDPDAIHRTTSGVSHGDNADPDASDPRAVAARTFRDHLERQVPGATEVLVDYMGRRKEAIGEPRPSLEEVAEFFRTQGSPLAILETLNVNGVEYGFVGNPPASLNSKSEIVDYMIEDLGLSREQERAVRDNTPGTNNDWMRFFGNHEGTHLQVNHYTKMTNLETLIEERRADQGAYDMARERGQEEIALAFKDLRSLHIEATHATTPLVDQNDQATEITYNTANNFRTNVNILIEENFDFAKHVSEGGKATKAETLFKEDPEAYFAAAQQAVDKVRDEAVADYNDNPALFDHQRAVIEAQLLIDYHKGFEDAYRRRVLGEDLPYRQPTQLISQEAEDAYIANMELHDKVTSVEHSYIGFVAYKSEFHKDRAFENYDWSTHPRKVEGKSDLTPDEKGQIVLDYFEEKKDAVAENFRNNPSKETYKDLMDCQSTIDQAVAMINYGRGKKGEEPIERVEIMSPIEKQGLMIEAFDARAREAAVKVAISVENRVHWNETYDKAFVENGGTVLASFDWESYEGSATDRESLYKEDPQAYFEHTYKVLGTMRQEALEAYEADPSHENMGRLIEVHDLLDTTNSSLIENDGEDGFDMDSVNVPSELSIDAPDLVSMEDKKQYYTERVTRKSEQEEVDAKLSHERAEGVSKATPDAVPDKGYEKGVNGGAYTTKVESEANGKPVIKHGEEGSSVETVNGKPVKQVFDEAASPDPSSVSMVDPKVDETQNTPMPPPVENTAQMDQGTAFA